jgi:predicted methyltransferase MtxX (methanogen marker protein 4)
MSLTSELKQAFNSVEMTRIDVEGLPTFFVGPMTIHQAQQIESEADTMRRLARHFQIRAKNEDGTATVKPGEFEDFCRYVDANLVGEAS